jgi:hypothetical protein
MRAIKRGVYRILSHFIVFYRILYKNASQHHQVS